MSFSTAFPLVDMYLPMQPEDRKRERSLRVLHLSQLYEVFLHILHFFKVFYKFYNFYEAFYKIYTFDEVQKKQVSPPFFVLGTSHRMRLALLCR